MTKRQILYGVICVLVGILIGMEIAGNLEALIRLIIIVAILLLLAYLALPYLKRQTASRRSPAQRMPQRRTGRKP